MNTKPWRLSPNDEGRTLDLARRCGVPEVVARLLLRRGVTHPDAITEFLQCKMTSLRDPSELPGITDAVPIIAAAIKRRDPIVVYGDYDADGMTSAAILVGALRLLDATVSYHVPNRISDGYGLNEDAIRRQHQLGKKVVITVDCGITNVSAAQLCRDLGVQLVITDHHTFADQLPDADAIVHPRLPGHSYPFGDLCGAGVAFKLAWALCQEICGGKIVTDALRQYLLRAMGLAAIGTVADMVPLQGENRILVKHGLRTLLKEPPAGLRNLMQLTKLDQKSQLSAEDISFMLAPRLNAAGRLGQAQLG
ncbi:MAG: DHH family phosphoesterase, partial [Planctomycetota bacterium]